MGVIFIWMELVLAEDKWETSLTKGILGAIVVITVMKITNHCLIGFEACSIWRHSGLVVYVWFRVGD